MLEQGDLSSLDRCYCPCKGNGGVLRGLGGGGRRVKRDDILDYDGDIEGWKEDVYTSVKNFPAHILTFDVLKRWFWIGSS